MFYPRIANCIEWWIIDVKQYKWLSLLGTKINAECDRLIIPVLRGDLWHFTERVRSANRVNRVDIVIWCYWWVVTEFECESHFLLCLLQELMPNFWFSCDCMSDIIFILDVVVQLRTGYLEQGLMVSTFHCTSIYFKLRTFPRGQENTCSNELERSFETSLTMLFLR